MKVIGKYIKDGEGMMGAINRCNPNKKYAEAFSLSKFAMRQLRAAVSIDEKMHWDKVLTACDSKMTFWKNRPKFDLQEMLALARKMGV
jgi:hypothetical protein